MRTDASTAKARLWEAAIGEFADRGFERPTVREICARCGESQRGKVSIRRQDGALPRRRDRSPCVGPAARAATRARPAGADRAVANVRAAGDGIIRSTTTEHMIRVITAAVTDCRQEADAAGSRKTRWVQV